MNSCKVRKYLFTTTGQIDKGQHRHGESYPWALGTSSRSNGWIGDTLPVA